VTEARPSAPHYHPPILIETMALRQVQISPEAESILDSVAASFGGDRGLTLSELLIAHESIESFLDVKKQPACHILSSMTYNLFEICWLIYAVAAILFAARMLSLRIWRTYPRLTIWACTTALIYGCSFVLNRLSQSLYWSTLPYLQVLAGLSFVFAALEVLDTLTAEMSRVAGLRRFFQTALALMFLLVIPITESETTHVFEMNTPTLVASRWAGSVIGFIIAGLLAFLILRSSRSRMSLVAPSAFTVTVVIGSVYSAALNFTSIIPIACIAFFILSTLILGIWAFGLGGSSDLEPMGAEAA
jgi:hypothetical protein